MVNPRYASLLPTSLFRPGAAHVPDTGSLINFWKTPKYRTLLGALVFFSLLFLLEATSNLRPDLLLDYFRSSTAPECTWRYTLPSPNGHAQHWEIPSPPLPISASLSKRLAAWRASPLASRNNWTQVNAQQCGNEVVRRNLNHVHVRSSRETWEVFDDLRKVEELREELIGVLEKAGREGRLEVGKERFSRGLVFTAGNVVRTHFPLLPIPPELTDLFTIGYILQGYRHPSPPEIVRNQSSRRNLSLRFRNSLTGPNPRIHGLECDSQDSQRFQAGRFA